MTTRTKTDTGYRFDGTIGNDIIYDTVGGDEIYAGVGNDQVHVSYGRDYVNGDAGDDWLYIGWSGIAENATVWGSSSQYAYVGNSYSLATRRVQFDGMEHLNVRTGSGDDSIQGFYNSKDWIDGGLGVDLWIDSFSTYTSGINVSMSAAQADVWGLQLPDGTQVRNVERAQLDLSPNNDTFTDSSTVRYDGTGYDDTVYGLAGDDRMTSTHGRDYLNGGEGDDTIVIDWHTDRDGATIWGSSSQYAYVGNSYSEATRRVQFDGMEHVEASAGSGDDSIQGFYNAWDKINGGAGDDLWIDSFSDSTGPIELRLQNNTLSGAWKSQITGIERVSLTLGQGNDTFRDYGEYDDVVYGSGGDDNLGTSNGRDYINGGAGDDRIFINWHDETDNATIWGSSSQYGYVGGSYSAAARRAQFDGIEHLQVWSGSGDDSIQGFTNAWDIINGGKGVDLWTDDFRDIDGLLKMKMSQISGPGGQQFWDGTLVKNIERVNLDLTERNDVFKGYGNYDDTIYGLGGNDDISTTGGRDYINGGEGYDLLRIKWGDSTENVTVWGPSSQYAYAGAGFSAATRSVQFDGMERLDVTTGSGDDRIQGFSNSRDLIDGGDGVDTWEDNFSNRSKRLEVDMKLLSSDVGTRLFDGSKVANIEQVDLVLTKGKDLFRDLGQFNDEVETGPGNDTVYTVGGIDRFNGQDGFDKLNIDWSDAVERIWVDGSLNGYAYVGASLATSARSVNWTSFEKVFVKLGAGDDYLSVDNGADTLKGGKGNDELRSHDRNDRLEGEAGNDTLRGGDGYDKLFGGKGDDTLYGENDGDWLYGGKGKDTLVGGDGSDRMIGGGGKDTLRGGTDADTFVISVGTGVDRVLDFEDGIDRIGLAGGLKFSQLRVREVDGQTLVELRSNGADLLMIDNIDVSDLGASDFIPV